MASVSQFRARLFGRRLRRLQSGLTQHHDDVGDGRPAAKFARRLHGGNLAGSVTEDHGMDGIIQDFGAGLMMVRFEAGLAVGMARVMRSHRASASGMIPSSCAMRSILRVVATATTAATPSRLSMLGTRPFS
jgi:hypothetical protein